ncbi:MAG: 16S rRNA (guanine(966)-N(2))-methyltransferase RsmD [Rickettsiaceae bacterium]|nr:16S rRNA (guanine(966)-N(2))-methyltransferase RsmD [Rickettsiaceae bacterium]
MKIITGKHKNRIIPTIHGAGYRPSTTKFREAIFSILSSGSFLESQPIINADILDLFAGSGSLSFEALSRGAKSVTLVDINPDYLKIAKNFAEKIGESQNITIYAADARTIYLSHKQFSIVFMDPPYNSKYIDITLKNLDKINCLTDNALIVIEMGKDESCSFNPNFLLYTEKLYGNNKLLILKYAKK